MASTKWKSCWTNSISFYNEMTGLADKESAVGIVYLDFRKAFDTLSPVRSSKRSC